jgi:hypothetical protein
MSDFIRVDVSTHGPIFDTAERNDIIDRYCRHTEDELGDEGVRMIRAYLATQYMYLGFNGGNPRDNPIPHDAGHYQEKIDKDRGFDAVVVNDDRVVYGPWLEGVSLNNLKFFPGRARRGLSPRFPGHQAFRRIGQVLDRAASDIAEREIKPYLEELDGRL